MELTAGTKLFSVVSDAQVVVVKAPTADVEIGCGGQPMVTTDPGGASGAPDDELAEGPLLGKRYADEELGLEVLCARAGDGTLTVGGTPLLLKGAKPLPASD